MTSRARKPNANLRLHREPQHNTAIDLCGTVATSASVLTPELNIYASRSHPSPARVESILANMVYTMKIYVDGGCRGNGQPGSIAAAAAVFTMKWGRQQTWTRRLPSYPTPTNQRAEITAIILALEQALERYEELDSDPWLDITIYSDSKYAIGCMTDWIYKWRRNGWLNSAGCEVANRDLIEEADDLDSRVRREGDVEYIWVPRARNQDADEACNDVLDDM